jgi:hypothetical protein
MIQLHTQLSARHQWFHLMSKTFLWAFKGFGGFFAICLVTTFFSTAPSGALLYVFGRFYIVIESFVSLRRVPVGVYEEVTWTQYIPHL